MRQDKLSKLEEKKKKKKNQMRDGHKLNAYFIYIWNERKDIKNNNIIHR